MIRQQLQAYKSYCQINRLKVNDYKTLKQYCYLNKTELKK